MNKMIIALLAAVTASVALGANGGISSNGGDNCPSEDGAAWFLGQQPVRYCMDVSPEFGLSRNALLKEVESVFAEWRKYIDDKKINDAAYVDMYPVGKDVQILLHTQYMGACDGTEDLRFAFGITDENVKRDSGRFYDPTSFAKRTSFDKKTGRGKGYIWLTSSFSRYEGTSPDWKLPYRLHGILLHEVGHTLGIAHVNGTIMDEHMGGYVLAGEDPTYGDFLESLTRGIDQRKELYVCESCSFSYVGGKLRGMSFDPGSNAFRKLVGREPKGEVESRLEGTSELVYSHNFLKQVTLILKDEEGEHRFPMEYFMEAEQLAMDFGDADVFKKARAENGDWANSEALHSNSSVRELTIKTEAGQVLDVIFTRNMNASVATLSLRKATRGESKSLFEAKN